MYTTEQDWNTYNGNEDHRMLTAMDFAEWTSITGWKYDQVCNKRWHNELFDTPAITSQELVDIYYEKGIKERTKDQREKFVDAGIAGLKNLKNE
jgi:hypothetical protein